MLVEALLSSTYPERNIRVTNVGTTANTSRDLLERWDADVLSQKPDFVSVLFRRLGG